MDYFRVEIINRITAFLEKPDIDEYYDICSLIMYNHRIGHFSNPEALAYLNMMDNI